MADSSTNPLTGVAQLLTGLGGLFTSSGDMSAARNAANVADPFSGQRGQYQPMLHDFLTNPGNNPMSATQGTNTALGQLTGLMNNPGQITSMPGYQFGMNQALEGVNRGAGASGLLNSGNRLTALQDRGQSYAHSWYDDTFNQMLQNVNANLGAGNQFLNAQGQGYGQLAQVSGATTGSPGAAAQALMQGRTNQANSLGTGIGGIATGLTNLLPGIQQWLNGGSTGGFTVPGGVPGMGTGGNWGTDTMGPPSDLFGGGDIMGPPSDLLGDAGLNFGDIFGGL